MADDELNLPRPIPESVQSTCPSSGPLQSHHCRNFFEFTAWKELCKGYDFAASRLIAAVWAYVVPLAAKPRSGCPSDGDECWNYILFLCSYIACITVALPACSVALINHCSSRALEMEKQGLSIRRLYYQKAQMIILESLGTTYGVAHSQLAMHTIRQLAYAGSHFVASEALTPDAHIFINITTGFVIEKNDKAAHSKDVLAFEKDSEIFVEERGTNEMRWGVLASFCVGIGYFSLAVLSISGISAACHRSPYWCLKNFGCSCSQSPYLVELALLLQNSWYYVCGYTWAVFWTYVWFGGLLTSETISPQDIMILDLLRALVLSGCFSFVALNILPFRVSDSNPAAGDMSARLRLLTFRSTAIVVVIALADLPNCLITKYLAHHDILGLSAVDQLRYIFATAAAGLLILPRVDTRLSRIDPPTVVSCFWREVVQWLVGLLCFAPWLTSVNVLTANLKETMDENVAVVVVSNTLLGILLTMTIAFISGVLNSAGNLSSLSWTGIVSSFGSRRYLELAKFNEVDSADSLENSNGTSCADESDTNTLDAEEYSVFEGLTLDGRITYVL